VSRPTPCDTMCIQRNEGAKPDNPVLPNYITKSYGHWLTAHCLIQGRSALHSSCICSRHCQHLPLQPPNHLQHNTDVSDFVYLMPQSIEQPLMSLFSVSGLILIFIEIPLLLRICPTSSKFDAFIRRFTTNYMRAAVYATMSVVQWLSIIVDSSSLIAAAVVLLIAAAFYALAGLKNQEFVGSKTLGGHGVAQMII
jgi:hypothetical protein